MCFTYAAFTRRLITIKTLRRSLPSWVRSNQIGCGVLITSHFERKNPIQIYYKREHMDNLNSWIFTIYFAPHSSTHAGLWECFLDHRRKSERDHLRTPEWKNRTDTVLTRVSARTIRATVRELFVAQHFVVLVVPCASCCLLSVRASV